MKAKSKKKRVLSATKTARAAGKTRGGLALGRGPNPTRINAILTKLDEAYPAATCALKHDNPFQLLISTILSAQCTDERVNQVTATLFPKYPDAAAFAYAKPA